MNEEEDPYLRRGKTLYMWRSKRCWSLTVSPRTLLACKTRIHLDQDTTNAFNCYVEVNSKFTSEIFPLRLDGRSLYKELIATEIEQVAPLIRHLNNSIMMAHRGARRPAEPDRDDRSLQFTRTRTRRSLSNGATFLMVSFYTITIAAALAIASQFSSLQSTDAAFAACAEAPATPEDRRSNTGQLKVATFNAAFLYLGTASHQLSCPGKDCDWKTLADAENHVTQIAAAIKTLDADIIQINEVEDCTALEAVIMNLAALGDFSYKPYLVKGLDTATGQNSALLTRVDPVVDLQRTEERATIPVSGSKCPSSSNYAKSKGVTKHFYTTFNVTGFSKPITLVGAHLLANPESTSRCYEREAQATVLAGLANAAVEEGHHAIIAGDLNDWSSVVPDKNNNAPISAALAILVGENFVEVASKVQQADRYSQWWDENNNCVYEDTEVSSLDHMLVSKSLSSGLTSVSFNHDLYTTSCSGYNSDHYPISIVLSEA